MSTMYSTGKPAVYLGVSVKTLQRWDREGRLTPERTDTGRRMDSKASLDGFMRRTPRSVKAPVACCRVSSAAQKPDLKKQRRVREQFCAARGVANVEFVEDVGGGLNLKRPKSLRLSIVWPSQLSQETQRGGLHARLANIRKDAAHRLTSDLTRRFETIVIEDLNVSGMAKNHSLAGAVLDCGFHEIRRQFLSKAPMRGGRVVAADRFFPSTQICSCCGGLTGPKGRDEIGVEEWACRECSVVHQRDRNAAINL